MLVYQRVFPTNLAHRNSWFTYEKWRFSSSQTVNLPECIPKNTNQRSNIVETLLPENGSRTERICFSYFVGLNIAILQETIYVNHPLQTHFHNFNHDIPHRILPSTSQNSRSFVLKITLLRVIPTMTYVLLLANLLAFDLAFYLANLPAFYLANILALYLAYLLAYLLTSYLAFYLAYLLAYLLAFYLAYLLAFYLTFYVAFYLAYLLAFYLAVEAQRCPLSSEGPRLRSSGAHWARKVPGWGPAVPTELGGSQVEVQRCPLSSEGPRLRSSGAHWARRVPGWGPAVPTQLRRSQVEVQRCPLRSDPCSWGPAVPTELGGSQVEVQRCPLSSEGPRLRSSGAHWARRVPGWGPAVPTQLRRSQVEVQRCPLRSDPCSWGPAVPT